MGSSSPFGEETVAAVSGQGLISSFLISSLLALNTEIVGEGCHCPVRIHRQVNVLMNQEVVAGSLADDFEVVHECLDERKCHHIGLKAKPRNTRALVFITTDRAHSAGSLGLKMRVE